MKWDPINLDKVKTYSIKERANKVGAKDFGKPWVPGGGIKDWVSSLPRILAAGDFTEAVSSMVRAAAGEKTLVLAMGAHGIKVGLNPLILDLLDRGILTGLALNGAGIIHDTELAMIGGTSEDVAAEIGRGRFGMAEETAKFLNRAVSEGAVRGLGLGESVGAMLVKEKFDFHQFSILARAYELEIPVTVHVALGTDIIHTHPSADGAAIGKASHSDFLRFARIVSTLEEGVFINLGSAVILPEVFLKALSLVRNLGYRVENLTTVNMDFIKQYRPTTNVVQRPTLEGGKGYNLVGHHEIMFPLLAAAVLEGLEDMKD